MDRSENMRRIRSKNTAPELAVRKLLRSLGYTGYRIHRKDLPGCPDVAFIARRKAIQVNGCFWHGHRCKKGGLGTKSNREYWSEKLERNRRRDRSNLRLMRNSGWKVLVIWECQIKDKERLTAKVTGFLREPAARRTAVLRR